MSWLGQYGLFLMQIVTVAVLFVVVIGVVASVVSKNKGEKNGKLVITSLNKKIEENQQLINLHLAGDNKAEIKQLKKLEKDATKKNKSSTKDAKKLVFVLDFCGDIKASANYGLTQCITSIISLDTEIEEVVICLESGGGMVHAYGLAAAQILRLRTANIKVTVCVDKVAASGGYMMAVVAEKIICAPYAIIGSIGVIAQLPNFYRFLQKHDVDFEQITAGKNKRTLTMFGKNTNEGREKLTEDINDIHDLFKQFVLEYRPNLNIDEVANGDTWFGVKAIEKNLVDSLQTSDEYLYELSKEHKLVKLTYEKTKSFTEKLMHGASTGIEIAATKIASYLHSQTARKN